MKLKVLFLSAFFGLGMAVVEAMNRADGIEIAPVWSAHPVGFSLLTHEEKQFVGFYDVRRTMTVGVRGLDKEEFEFVQLPRRTGWDSHNYITMAVDNDGFLHLAGDMHGSKLLYFRTEHPGDISSFRQIGEMVGRDEARMTYPRFSRGPGNELIFTYRQGGSGNGEQIYNRYEVETQTWKRLLDQPLVSGEGLKNAYLDGPRRGPDGFYHLAWIWRDTPDCETNHHISYARSRDLMSWERGDGKALELPITFGSGAVVDPVEPGGGAINNNVRLGFDSRHRPIISYHKFDDDGNTQVYNARLEEGEWKIYQTTVWEHRWWFEGRGSIIFKLRVRNVVPVSEGRLSQDFDHWIYGNFRLILDEETLQPVEEREVPRSRPAELEIVESDFPGMQVRWAGDLGRSPSGSRYLLRWETMPQNRDRARKGDLPEPTMLRLYDLGAR